MRFFVSLVLALTTTTAVFGAERALVVVEQAAGRVSSYDPGSGARLGSLAVGFNPHEVAVSRDGLTAYVTNFGIQDYDQTIGIPGRSVSVIDLATMVERRRLDTASDAAPHGVKLRPPHDEELFVNTEFPAAMLVYDTATGSLLRRFAVDPATHNFVFSADGTTLFLMAGPNGVIRVDPETGAESGRFGLSTPARGLAWAADGRRLLVAGKDELGLFDSTTLALVKHYGNLGVGQILYAEMTPDGRHIIAPAVWDSQVLVIDAVDGSVVKRIVTGLDPVAVAIDPEGQRAFVSNARAKHVTAIDLTTLMARTLATDAGPNGLAFGVKPAERATETLVFAAPLPLSGREATFGRELMLGYEFWKEQVNVAGGLLVGTSRYRIETRYTDTRSDLGTIAGQATELLDGGASFFLGTYGSPANERLATIARERRVPLVASTAAAQRLYEQGNDWLFGIMAPASEYLKGSIEVALANAPAAQRLAIVARDAPAPLEDARAAEAYADARGLARVERPIVYPATTVDFAPHVERLKALNPDYLVFAGDFADAVSFVREAARQRFAPLGLAFSVGPSLPAFYAAKGLGSLATNLIGPTQWTEAASPAARDFAKRFWDRYNEKASYVSAGAAATGAVFVDALTRAGRVDPWAVRAALASTELEGFYGPIRFDARGLNVTKPVYTIQLQSGQDGVVREVIVWPGVLGERAVWPFPGFAEIGAHRD